MIFFENITDLLSDSDICITVEVSFRSAYRPIWAIEARAVEHHDTLLHCKTHRYVERIVSLGQPRGEIVAVELLSTHTGNCERVAARGAATSTTSAVVLIIFPFVAFLIITPPFCLRQAPVPFQPTAIFHRRSRFSKRLRTSGLPNL